MKDVHETISKYLEFVVYARTDGIRAVDLSVGDCQQNTAGFMETWQFWSVHRRVVCLKGSDLVEPCWTFHHCGRFMIHWSFEFRKTRYPSNPPKPVTIHIPMFPISWETVSFRCCFPLWCFSGTQCQVTTVSKKCVDLSNDRPGGALAICWKD